MLKLTWPRVAAWRVRRHYLDQRLPAGNMLAVASRLCGLHAQVLSSAVLTLWARVEELDRYAVQRALWQDRTLVKTWAMRGTLHLVPSDDLPLWHAALTTSRRYSKPGLWRRFGLTLEELDRLTESIGDALNGAVMTREELAQRVGQLTGSRKLARSSQLSHPLCQFLARHYGAVKSIADGFRQAVELLESEPKPSPEPWLAVSPTGGKSGMPERQVIAGNQMQSAAHRPGLNESAILPQGPLNSIAVEFFDSRP